MLNIEILKINGFRIAKISADGIIINNTQDALDLMGNCSYQEAYKIIIAEENIIPAFFDLKTGIAGDILQKFSTYNMSLAITGNFEKFSGKSLNDFIYESNKYGRINFVNNVQEAIEKLCKSKY